ncbi:hypothetical protein M3J09_008418 [Ascochyta lentis]
MPCTPWSSLSCKYSTSPYRLNSSSKHGAKRHAPTFLAPRDDASISKYPIQCLPSR